VLCSGLKLSHTYKLGWWIFISFICELRWPTTNTTDMRRTTQPRSWQWPGSGSIIDKTSVGVSRRWVCTAVYGMVRSCVLNAETLSAFTANWGSVFHCDMVATKEFLYCRVLADMWRNLKSCWLRVHASALVRMRSTSIAKMGIKYLNLSSFGQFRQ